MKGSIVTRADVVVSVTNTVTILGSKSVLVTTAVSTSVTVSGMVTKMDSGTTSVTVGTSVTTSVTKDERAAAVAVTVVVV